MVLRFHTFSDLDSGFSFRIGHKDDVDDGLRSQFSTYISKGVAK